MLADQMSSIITEGRRNVDVDEELELVAHHDVEANLRVLRLLLGSLLFHSTSMNAHSSH